MNQPLRVALLAGESSGDILGAGLMRSIKALIPGAVFSGIGGPLMEAQGLVSRAPMERLSVMGLVEPLKRLPELLSIRKDFLQACLADPPDVFIGIDSPGFNLGLERKLKQAGITTVHYVSPQVWAWRRGRVKKIKRSVDLILTLFPFEAAFYQDYDVAVRFVGHPLADEIPLQVDTGQARQALGLDPGAPVLALLPGSREGEVSRLGPVFLSTAARCGEHWPALQIVLPCAGEARRLQVQALIDQHTPGLNVVLVTGRSREVMAAADTVLLASGTASLEAMLLKKPMVVAYRMAPLSYAIISRMLKAPYISLPNLLTGKGLVTELLQDQVTVDNLYRELVGLFDNRDRQRQLADEYLAVHQQLKRNASNGAAQAILALCNRQHSR